MDTSKSMLCFVAGAVAGAVAWRYLLFMSLALSALYLLYVYRSALQGMGNTLIPMLSGILEFIMRTGFVLGLTAFIGSDGIFWAEISAWIGAAILLGISYYVIFGKLYRKGSAA